MDARENFKRTTLRLPQELYEKLESAAGKKRSLNAEIIARLEDTFEREEVFDPTGFSEGQKKAILAMLEAVIRKPRDKDSPSD